MESLDSVIEDGNGDSMELHEMIAEWEREAIIERTRNGRLQRYKDECWAGGNVPYGYAYDKETRKLIIDEVEARIVRRIYSEYSQGKTLYGICEGLNKDKVPGRGKNCQGWRQTAVRQVLVNPMYKGIQIVNRHAHISDITSHEHSAHNPEMKTSCPTHTTMPCYVEIS